MPFKVFDAYGAASRPEATLRTSGYLFLSRGIVKRAGKENATHAQIMFDEESDQLAIRLHDQLDIEVLVNDGTIKEVSSEKSGISVNLAAPIRYYNFPDPKAVGKQVFQVNFIDGLIVIDMRDYRKAKPRSVADLIGDVGDDE